MIPPVAAAARGPFLAFAALLCIGYLFSDAALAGEDARVSPSRLCAQNTPPSENTPSARHPWIWEARAGHGAIWLVGCLHLGAPSDVQAYSAYLPCYRASSTVYFETVPGSWDTFEVKQFIDRRGFLHDRQRLANIVSGHTWQSVKNSLESRPSLLDSISRMQPWLAAFTLTQEEYARAGLKTENSLEAYIQRHATDDRKPVGALESPKDQILAMADASAADQEEFLRGTVNGLEHSGAQTAAIREAWLSGDLHRLQEALGISPGAKASGMHQHLIAARNQRWVRKIQEIEARKLDVMVLVGAEHLVAEPGALPELLVQAGFSVRRGGSENK